MKKTTIFIIFISVFAILVGCRGNQQSKIVGLWKEVPYVHPDSALHIKYWQFYSGSSLVITKYTEGVATDSTEYDYNIDGSVFSVFAVDRDDSNYSTAKPDARGEYWVDVLTKDTFKATKRKNPDGTTDAAYIRKELVKIE